MNLIKESSLPLSRACGAINFSRATFYRHSNISLKANKKVSSRALTKEEEQTVLDVLHEPRFMDSSCGQVYACLLDEGRYVASERTMYRILSKHNELKERRQIKRHPQYKKPELLARGPNQLWSWDITRLRGPHKLEYYHLYVMLDVYSRYVVGWILAHRESSELAKHLIESSCVSQGVVPGKLVIHSDRGPSMKSKGVADLLDYLGVIKSHSRPRVSNDNPYSESQFKTMKYCHTYPNRFGSIEDARGFCNDFFAWYNNEHYHSGLQMLTPVSVHRGQGDKILAKRAQVMIAAYKRNKSRFINGKPKIKKLIREVWINPPKPNNGHIVTNNQEVTHL